MVSQPVRNQNSLNLFLNNYFSIILAVVLILFLFFAYLILLSPKFRATQAAISANTEEKQLLYETTQKKLASLKIVSEIYQKISPADLKKFDSVLPDSYARERLFGELEEIISRGGWLISSITISPEEDVAKTPATVDKDGAGNPALATTLNNKKVGTVSLQLSLTAIDYPGFKNLLRLLERNLRLFDITSVNFSPEADAATVVISTYYYQSP